MVLRKREKSLPDGRAWKPSRKQNCAIGEMKQSEITHYRQSQSELSGLKITKKKKSSLKRRGKKYFFACVDHSQECRHSF